jgi:hypothetical protein
MRFHSAAAALGVLALTNTMAFAQTPETSVPTAATAPSVEAPEGDLKAKIQATEKARDELRQRFEADSAKKGSKDAKNDARLHALSNTVCSGCGGASPSNTPPRRSPSRHSAQKRAPAAPEEPPIVDDVN